MPRASSWAAVAGLEGGVAGQRLRSPACVRRPAGRRRRPQSVRGPALRRRAPKGEGGWRAWWPSRVLVETTSRAASASAARFEFQQRVGAAQQQVGPGRRRGPSRARRRCRAASASSCLPSVAGCRGQAATGCEPVGVSSWPGDPGLAVLAGGVHGRPGRKPRARCAARWSRPKMSGTDVDDVKVINRPLPPSGWNIDQDDHRPVALAAGADAVDAQQDGDEQQGEGEQAGRVTASLRLRPQSGLGRGELAGIGFLGRGEAQHLGLVFLVFAGRQEGGGVGAGGQDQGFDPLSWSALWKSDSTWP